MRNEFGEWVPGAESRTDIRVATAPSGQSRDPFEGGVRLEGMRTFLVDGPRIRPIKTGTDASDADLILYRGEYWRVMSVDIWDRDEYAATDVDWRLVVTAERRDPQ